MSVASATVPCSRWCAEFPGSSQLSPSLPACWPSVRQPRLPVVALGAHDFQGILLHVSVKHVPGQHTSIHSWVNAHTFSTQGAVSLWSLVDVSPGMGAARTQDNSAIHEATSCFIPWQWNQPPTPRTTSNSQQDRTFEISSEPHTIQTAFEHQTKAVTFFTSPGKMR